MNTFVQILQPSIIIVIGALLVLLLGISSAPVNRRMLPGLTLLTLVIAFCVVPGLPEGNMQQLVSPDDSLLAHPLARYAVFLTIEIAVLLTLVGWLPDRKGLKPELAVSGEYFSLMLLAIVGTLLIFTANNLVVLFLALELASIPTYIMVAISRPHVNAREAALKYFLLGALSAAIIAYGFSFLYGVAGTIAIPEIKVALAGQMGPTAILAFVLILVGLAFKIAAVPMHFYTADVYQGAANPTTALLAFLPKISGFFVLIIIINCYRSSTGGSPETVIVWLLWILAALTMTVGNVLALMQQNTKRILAWSSVAHSGYMMLGLLALYAGAVAGDAVSSLIFYIFVYSLATIAVFAVLSQLERDNQEAQHLKDLNGLSRKHPAMASALAVCIFSLLGMPLTAGFSGKLIIFSTYIKAAAVPGHVLLLVIAMLNTAVAAAYYLRIIAACYIDGSSFTATLRFRSVQFFGIVLAAFLTILLGLLPHLLFKPLDNAAQDSYPPSQAVVVSTQK